MYQAWPWSGTPSVAANPTAGGFVPPAVSVPSGQVTQWPAGYNQYAALTPEMQQQWAAAWATQAQYAYGGAVPVAGQAPNTAVPYPAPSFPEAQPPAVESSNAQSSPSEQPKNASSEPKDSAELDKLKQLKEQAEQWKTLQQPTAAAATASWNYSSAGVSVTEPTATTSGAALNKAANTSSSQPNQLDAEEEEFEKQFSDWEKQFDAWKEQNQGHPDKEAFAQYEKQWQEWRATLLLKKEQMQKAKAERAAAAAAAAATTPSTTAPAAVDVNAGMYYQQQAAQYMYMQPYMYPPGGMVPPPPMGVQPPFVGGEMFPPPQQENPNAANPKEASNFEPPGQHGPPPPNEYQHYDEYGNMYPPDMEEQQQRFPNDFGRGRGGRGAARGRGGRWSNANNADPEMRPGLLDNPGGMQRDFPPEDYPGDFHEGGGNFGGNEFPPPPAFRDGDFNSGPPLNRQQGPPPFDYPPDEFGDGNYPNDGDGPARQRRKFDDRFREGPLPGKTPLLSHDGTTPSLLQRDQGPPPQPSNRYPPDDFDEPPFDDGPPFPPEGGFGGRPPFHPRGNGRFPPRGRRFPPPHGDFDRFGGPPPPHFHPGDGPPFGPDDRFPFPGDRPPRMPMRGGPRGGGHFGGGPRGGFPPEDPFFREGGPPPPMRFKSKDYTHRTAEDFDPHYEYENDYQEDVMHFRAPKRNNKRPAPRKAEKKPSE